MRSTLLVLCLLLPTMGFGQSLGELAKKEKERREKNKEEGKEVLVISSDALAPESEPSSETESTPQTATAPRSSGRTLTPTGPRRSEEENRQAFEEDSEEDEQQMKTDDTVRSYKLLTQVERAFRSFKSMDLKVRPIRHRRENRVRAHVFLCMLAYYVLWHMMEAWRPLLFSDEDQQAKARRDPGCSGEALRGRPAQDTNQEA